MVRWAYCAALFAALAAVVGAQGPPPGNAVELAAMQRQNRELLRRLVDSSVEVSRIPEPIGRLESGGSVLRELVGQIGEAARTGDADRASELGTHLRAMLEDGIIPNLREARERIAPGSREEAELFRQRDEMEGSLRSARDRLREGFAAEPPPELRQMLDGLESARRRVAVSAD